MRIAIVNNLPSAIATMRRILLSVPDYKLAWIAHNGVQAVAKCAQDTPDLILMDLLMPVMDGLKATKEIMKNSPCGILIVTNNIDTNVAQVYEAMGYGALDVVNIPRLDTDSEEMATALLAKITKIRKLLKTSTNLKIKSLADQTSDSYFKQSPIVPLVAIGSSTGGPKALATILSDLPTNFDKAILIVQHVDAQFSSGFVEWLNQQTVLPVKLAVAGDYPKKGTVLVAGNNDHLYLTPNLKLDYTQDPIDYPYRPSVDVFFKSLAEHWKFKGTAILLTGMGRDGAEGLSALRRKGWNTIAQNQESCIVYGMPKAAIELKAAVKVLPLNAIATELLNKTFYPVSGDFKD